MTMMADLAAVMPSEAIEAGNKILAAHLAVPVALSIADTASVGKGSGNNVQIPRINNITIPADNKTEAGAGAGPPADEFEFVETTMDQENLSGAWIGFADLVSWESNIHTLVNSVELVVGNGMAHVADRVDKDGLAMLASIVEEVDYNGDNLTDDIVLEAIHDFELLNPHPGPRAGVFGIGQMLQWQYDLKGNGAQHFAGDPESERIAQMMGARQGFVGVRHGLNVFKSNNVPVAGGDATGAILKMGQGGPLVYRSWKPIGWENEWKQLKQGWEVVVSAYNGWALSDPFNAIKITTSATYVPPSP